MKNLEEKLKEFLSTKENPKSPKCPAFRRHKNAALLTHPFHILQPDFQAPPRFLPPTYRRTHKDFFGGGGYLPKADTPTARAYFIRRAPFLSTHTPVHPAIPPIWFFFTTVEFYLTIRRFFKFHTYTPNPLFQPHIVFRRRVHPKHPHPNRHIDAPFMILLTPPPPDVQKSSCHT